MTRYILEDIENEIIQHECDALMTWKRYGCTRTALEIFESEEESNFYSVEVELTENQKVHSWKKIITETPIFETVYTDVPIYEEIEGEQVIVGYETEQVQTGVLISVSFEPVIIAKDWLYDDRHIRISIPKNICISGGDYAAYLTTLVVEKVPFDTLGDYVVSYYRHLNFSDGFSLDDEVIHHIDPRLTIEQFGEFDTDIEKIFQIDVAS